MLTNSLLIMITKDYKKNRFFGLAAIMVVMLLCCQNVNAQLYSSALFTNKTHNLSKTQKGVKLSTDIAVLALPVATLAGVIIEQDWEGLKEGAFTAAATLGSTYLLKSIVREERPDGSSFDSFPSGHTSVTFATATFLQLRYGWKVGVPAYIVSTYVAWGRAFSKRHHAWDVVAGAAIGAGSALIFTHPWAKKHELSIAPVATNDAIGFATSFNL